MIQCSNENTLKTLLKHDIHLTKFKNNQILLNKISHRFLPTTKLCTGRKTLIFKPDFLHHDSGWNNLPVSSGACTADRCWASMRPGVKVKKLFFFVTDAK
jgi:hypothetical protein